MRGKEATQRLRAGVCAVPSPLCSRTTSGDTDTRDLSREGKQRQGTAKQVTRVSRMSLALEGTERLTETCQASARPR